METDGAMRECDEPDQHTGPALNRRNMLHALAAGAAGSGAITQAFAQNQPAIASAADYVRDPNRWAFAD